MLEVEYIYIFYIVEHFGKELLAGMISLLLYCSWKLFVDKITTSFNKTYTQQDSM